MDFQNANIIYRFRILFVIFYTFICPNIKSFIPNPSERIFPSFTEMAANNSDGAIAGIL